MFYIGTTRGERGNLVYATMVREKPRERVDERDRESEKEKEREREESGGREARRIQ